MRKLKVLGIPFDFGQSHMGVRLAADYLRNKGLLKRLSDIASIEDYGNLFFPFKTENSTGPIKHVKEASEGNHKISSVIEQMDLRNDFLLSIGGDHGMALGTIHGLLKHHPDSVVVWADAHGDINSPETSPSGHFHGMPLSFLLNFSSHPLFPWIRRHLMPQKLILIGPRDLDQGEKDIIAKHSIQYYSSDELNRVGAKDIIEMALHRADPHGVCPIHLSFDVDFFDQLDIQATGTKVPQGPILEEVFLLGGLLAETGRLASMDLVEFNPLIGNEQEVTNSSELIMDFIEATLKHVFDVNVLNPFLPKKLLMEALDKNLL